jgi:HK97 gp10 family phage protein
MQFKVEVDSASVIAALDRLGPSADIVCKAVARETAERIRTAARSRVRVDTGQTQSHIVVEETHNGEGYIVWVEPDVRISLHTNKKTGRQHTQKVTYNAVGSWNEFGTEKMTAQPFLFNSAHLEEGPHRRRLIESLQDSIDDLGLGE